MKKNDFVSFAHVNLRDGFWQNRYILNKNVAVKNVAKRFEESGRFDAMRFNFAENQKRPHIYFDSDVAKWIEAVAYLIELDGECHKDLVSIIDEMIDCMEKAQREDGYLNSFHQQIEPFNIFKIRDHHELYCAGHLIEAAIAYHKATGKDKLLNIMKRYCDCIDKAFFTEKTASFETPGHEEIELALFALYRYTGIEKYRVMAEGFIERRGKNPDEQYIYPNNRAWSQDNALPYELDSAVGHSVRALYLYCGMADMALESNSEKLIVALHKLFDDITNKKMYVTGGVGSTHQYEGFTLPYDLPNSSAYSESCCAIAMIMFAMRMRRLDDSSKYGEIIERVLYNNLLSSSSLDGKSFFYSNPLEISLQERQAESVARRKWLPETRRVEVFKCSCCPPNINRFFARLADVICFDREDHTYIEQYISSDVDSVHGTVSIREEYATKGIATVFSDNYNADIIKLRIPQWSKNATVTLNGEKLSKVEAVNGYMSIKVGKSFEIKIDFAITPTYIASNPKIISNAGRIAMSYGPVVYCLEGVDNGNDLNELSAIPNCEGASVYPDFHGLCSIEADGYRDKASDALYFDSSSSDRIPVRLKFIPYFAFANRDACDMLVWVRKA